MDAELLRSLEECLFRGVIDGRLNRALTASLAKAVSHYPDTIYADGHRDVLASLRNFLQDHGAGLSEEDRAFVQAWFAWVSL